MAADGATSWVDAVVSMPLWGIPTDTPWAAGALVALGALGVAMDDRSRGRSAPRARRDPSERTSRSR